MRKEEMGMIAEKRNEKRDKEEKDKW